MESDIQQPERQAPPPHVGSNASCEPSADVVDECARRLERLTRRVDEFLGRQLEKLDQACGDSEHRAASHAAFEQMSRDLRNQQLLWERSKQQQTERIAEEVEMLTEAWDQIETERRTLLADDAGTGAAPSDVVASAPALPATEPPHPNLSNPCLANPAEFFDFESAGTGRSAALQFQQIKREMRQHARRSPS